MLRKFLLYSSIRGNVVANAAGNFWTGLMNFIFVPIYIFYLGPEGYGLVGIFASLLVILSLLDAGLGAVVNRELAMFSVNKNESQEKVDLIKTLEVVYWLISLMACIIIFLLSPLLSKNWVNPEKLTSGSILLSFYYMAISLFFRFPLSFYAGGLMGLQRQVPLNVLNILGVTIRALGSVAALKYYKATVEAFFIWQIIASIIHTLLAFFLLHFFLPKGFAAHFRIGQLKSIKHFALGIAGISIAALVLNQMDKIILSKLISLKEFGYYVFAFSVGGVLSLISNIIPQALYPRFTQLVTIKNELGLRDIYRKGCGLSARLILPITVIILFFAPELLIVWTKNQELVNSTQLLVRGLFVAMTFQALMPVPYMLTLAYGRTNLMLWINIFSIIVLLPLFLILTHWMGSAGAVIVWIILTSGYIIIAVPLIHNKLLRGESRYWYINTFGLPLIIPAIISLATYILISFITSMVFKLMLIGISYFISVAVLTWLTPYLRVEILKYLTDFRFNRSKLFEDSK